MERNVRVTPERYRQTAIFAALALALLVSAAAAQVDFTPHLITSSASGAVAVATEDFDRDGNLDFVTAEQNSDSIRLYLGQGLNSSFLAPLDLTTSAFGARDVKVADLNKDGDPDVIAVSFLDDTLAWFEHNSEVAPAVPTFTERIITQDPDTPFTGNEGVLNGPVSLTIADVDGDGDLDIICAAELNDTVAWYRNELSAGAPPTFTEIIIAANITRASSVAAGDVDRDGHIDIAAASYENDNVTLFYSDGASSPTFTPVVIQSAADGITNVHMADVTRNGAPDIFYCHGLADQITWHHVSTTGSLTGPLSVGFFNPFDFPRQLITPDLNGDADRDVAVVASGNDLLTWYENVIGNPVVNQFFGDGTTTGAIGAFGLAAGDFDNDLDIDLVVTNTGADEIVIFENLLPPGAFQLLKINELRYNDSGANDFQFIELFNAGVDPLQLHNYELVRVSNGALELTTGTVYRIQPRLLQPGEHHTLAPLIGGQNLPLGVADEIAAGFDALLDGGPSPGLALRTVTSGTLVEVVIYQGAAHPPGSTDAGDAGTAGGDNRSLARFPDGADSNVNTNDFQTSAVSFGAPNEQQDISGPGVVIREQFATQAIAPSAATGELPVCFDVIFEEPMAFFDAADVLFTGSTTVTSHTVTQVTGARYTLCVNAISGPGSFAPYVPAGGALDVAGNLNLASTFVGSPVIFIDAGADARVWERLE